MALDTKKSFPLALAITFAVFLAGCATVQTPEVSEKPIPSGTSKPPLVGVKHKVKKGETLWRIAKTYGVLIDDIIQANAIPNAASIELNQLIFIPGATALKDTGVLSPTEKGNDYLWPVKGKVIAYFDDMKNGVLNTGIDVSVVEGEFVRAARDGYVVLADRLPGNGYTVILEHADGFFTIYAHNERLMVKLADRVLQGDNIAQAAREGNLAYLHFEVRKGDAATNPLHYLP